MTHLTEDVLSAVLKETVPEPITDPDRASRARMQARRMRARRRGVVASAVAAVGALVVGVPALVSTAPDRSVNGPAQGSTTTQVTGPRPCVQAVCRSAAVIAAVRQPLHFATVPSSKECPVSPVRRFSGGAGFSGPFAAIGPGPLYLTGASDPARALTMSPTAGPWFEQKVIWVIDRSYSGALLLRGRRIDGVGELKFVHYIGAVGYTSGAWDGKYRELAYVRNGLTATAAGTLDSMPSGVYVQSSGCYAIQVDGVGFSETMVFRVRAT